MLDRTEIYEKKEMTNFTKPKCELGTEKLGYYEDGEVERFNLRSFCDRVIFGRRKTHHLSFAKVRNFF